MVDFLTSILDTVKFYVSQLNRCLFDVLACEIESLELFHFLALP